MIPASEDLLIGLLIATIMLGFGFIARRVAKPGSLLYNPFFFIMIGMIFVLLILDLTTLYVGYLSDENAAVIYCFAVIGFAIGHTMGRCEDNVKIWEINHPEYGRNYIHNETTYVHKGIQYVMEPSLAAVSRAVFLGLRDPINLNMAGVNNLTSFTIRRRRRHRRYQTVIPVACSEHPDYQYFKLKFGYKKETDQFGYGVKVPRYLWCPVVKAHNYLPATRAYQMPEAFWHDVNAYSDAIISDAQSRAKVTRMEIAWSTAKREGVVEHVKNMLFLDTDNEELIRNLPEFLEKEQKRRERFKTPTTEEFDGS